MDSTWTRSGPQELGQASLGLAFAAGIHASVIGEHLQEAPVEGWFFAVLTLAEGLAALALLLRPTRTISLS